MEPAAFFDLDRTLLTGASGPMFSAMLKRVGLLPDRSIPGEGLVFKFFDVVGETLPSMMATRQMARAANSRRSGSSTRCRGSPRHWSRSTRRRDARS